MYNLNRIINTHKDLASSELLLLFGLKFWTLIRGTENGLVKVSNKELCAFLHQSEPTLIKSRRKLVLKGILYYLPAKTKSKVSIYGIINIRNQSLSKLDNQLKDLDKVITLLKEDEIWQDKVVESIRGIKGVDIKREDLNKWIDKFHLKLLADEVEDKNIRDAKKHFSNWLNIQIDKQKKYKNNNVSIKTNVNNAKFKAGGGWEDLLSNVGK